MPNTTAHNLPSTSPSHLSTDISADTTTPTTSDMLVSKTLLAADYNTTHEAMLERTLERIALKKEHSTRTPDELWIVDHNDVYTLGQAGKEEHILQHTDTPIIKTDRGGQVTWHGHGQLVVYWLFDLHSLGWGVRDLVSHAEQAIEDVVNDILACHSATSQQTAIRAHARRDAPGVYLYADSTDTLAKANADLSNTPTDAAIMLGKIASLGFKIKHGFSYHGIALNVDCDLSAFNAINPCGYAGMQMLRLADFAALGDTLQAAEVADRLINNIAQRHAGSIALRRISAK